MPVGAAADLASNGNTAAHVLFLIAVDRVSNTLAPIPAPDTSPPRRTWPAKRLCFLQIVQRNRRPNSCARRYDGDVCGAAAAGRSYCFRCPCRCCARAGAVPVPVLCPCRCCARAVPVLCWCPPVPAVCQSRQSRQSRRLCRHPCPERPENLQV